MESLDKAPTDEEQETMQGAVKEGVDPGDLEGALLRAQFRTCGWEQEVIKEKNNYAWVTQTFV